MDGELVLNGKGGSKGWMSLQVGYGSIQLEIKTCNKDKNSKGTSSMMNDGIFPSQKDLVSLFSSSSSADFDETVGDRDADERKENMKAVRLDWKNELDEGLEASRMGMDGIMDFIEPFKSIL